MFFDRVLLKRALIETFQEYFQKTSINGFGLLYYIRRRKYQRIIWFISIIFGCCFAAYVSFLYVTNFMQNPTVTVLAPFKERISLKSFPAIAICSANKISRVRAESLAEELIKRLGYTRKDWLEKILLLAGYYEDRINDLDDSIAFELQLREVFGEDYDIAQFLKNLAPSCEELLLECHYARAQRNCSDIFKTVALVEGFCCVFNHRENHDEKNFRKTHYIFGVGMKSGLTVLLNASTSDYFYKARSMNGFHVKIFEIGHFPDSTTGGVRDIMVGTGSDVRVELSLTSQSADGQSRRFSYLRRRCFFEDENLGEGVVAYSLPECLSRCRLNSQLQICGCAPHYTPQEYLEGLDNVTICSLADLECFTAFYATWRIYRPRELVSDVLSQESLPCPDCYPLCSFNNYQYRKESNKLEKMLYARRNIKYTAKLKNNTAALSLVRFYFSEALATQYDKKVLFNWFQIMSNIGGVLGISIGCSIISGFELLYFFTYRFAVNFINLRKIQNKA